MCVGSAPNIEIPEVPRPVKPVLPVETAKSLVNPRAAGADGKRRRRQGAAGLTIPMSVGSNIK